MLLEGLGDEGPEEPTFLEASQPNASPEVLGHASVQIHQGLGTRVAGGRGVAARCHGRSSQFPVARASLRGNPPFLRCRAIVPGRVECPRGRVGRRIAVEAHVHPCAFGHASSEVPPRIPAMCENQQENSPADRHSKPINTWAPADDRQRTSGLEDDHHPPSWPTPQLGTTSRSIDRHRRGCCPREHAHRRLWMRRRAEVAELADAGDSKPA